jgi:3-hydroxymyristoyl/3-hydroxydecanoyl-(acyl carrier protein) dehydratase
VSGSDPFMLGHYPQDGIFPGVMSLRCMLMLSQKLFDKISDNDITQLELKRITFLSDIRPGDILNILCKVQSKTTDQISFNAHIEVNNEIKTKSTFIYSFK